MAFPLRLPDEEHFRRVRDFLDHSGYTESAAAERIGFARLDQISEYSLCDHQQRDRNLRIRDPLGVIVKLFLCGQPLASSEIREFVTGELYASFEALGLLETSESGIFSPVLLYPAYGLYLASDRYMNPDGSDVSTGGDFVYLVLQRNSADFIAGLPDSPCETFLDLAAGCGVAALWAAQNFAAQSWSADITERATHFAEFNRRLNAIPNVHTVCGDLYAPVAGRRFDRIASHPPYAISPENGYVYADGGEDGEALTRRVIAEAPAHLEPGGILSCMAMISDREGESAEQRMRGWLGEASASHDIAVLVHELIPPQTYATDVIASRKGHLRELSQWRALFSRHRIRQFVYGNFMIRRHTPEDQEIGRPPFTVRRMRTEATGRRAVDWMLAWESYLARGDSGAILSLVPNPAVRAELLVTHSARDGTLQPTEYRFQTRYPFQASLTCKPWLAYLFSRCDGRRTAAELYAEVREHLPSGAGQQHFVDALCALISGGFLEVPGFRLPAEG